MKESFEAAESVFPARCLNSNGLARQSWILSIRASDEIFEALAVME